MAPDAKEKNTYLNDPESGAEMMRLLDQDHTLTTCMGGVWPEQHNPDAIQDVLDIACGPGGWVQEIAFIYPAIQITGIDISQAMIEYATMQARVQHLDNAHFHVMDATRQLDFPDASFDLVNSRTIAGFMRTSIWPTLIQECMRLLRPGGILRITETDHWGTSNAPAFSTLMDLTYLAASLSEHSFDPSRHTFGITPMLAKLFRSAGFQNIESRAHAIDFSSGAPAHQAMHQNFRVFFQLVQPFLLKVRNTYPHMGIPDQEELEHLYEQMDLEMIDNNFAGIFYLLTVWGLKPN